MVDLRAIGHELPAGHRLRLSLSPTCWPWAWPSPEPVTLTLALGADTRLTLPLLTDALEPAPWLSALEIAHGPELASRARRRGARAPGDRLRPGARDVGGAQLDVERPRAPPRARASRSSWHSPTRRHRGGRSAVRSHDDDGLAPDRGGRDACARHGPRRRSRAMPRASCSSRASRRATATRRCSRRTWSHEIPRDLL